MGLRLLTLALSLVLGGCHEVLGLEPPSYRESGGTDTGASGAGAAGAGGSSASTSTGGTGGAAMADYCGAGMFATGLDGDGKLVCASLASTVAPAVRQGCSVYWGWRDGCGVCDQGPTKWGRVNGDSCVAMGDDTTCSVAWLDNSNIQLFGLNTDGGVDETDKFYLGFSCKTPPEMPGECASGDFMVGLAGDLPICLPASSFAVAAAEASCSVYFGWSDGCDGCDEPPKHWGRASTNECEVGAGSGGTCGIEVLGEVPVHLYGLNTAGKVGGNSQFYIGMRCAPPAGANSVAVGQCPNGQIVTGLLASGELACTSPAPLMMEVASASCSLWLGWINNCNGCATAPTRWGSVGETACVSAPGTENQENTCTTEKLGVPHIRLFGLSTVAPLNGDDTFPIGFTCE